MSSLCLQLLLEVFVYFCSFYFLLYMLSRTFQLADATEPTYKARNWCCFVVAGPKFVKDGVLFCGSDRLCYRDTLANHTVKGVFVPAFCSRS